MIKLRSAHQGAPSSDATGLTKRGVLGTGTDTNLVLLFKLCEGLATAVLTNAPAHGFVLVAALSRREGTSLQSDMQPNQGPDLPSPWHYVRVRSKSQVSRGEDCTRMGLPEGVIGPAQLPRDPGPGQA